VYSQYSCVQPVQLCTASIVVYSQYSCVQQVQLNAKFCIGFRDGSFNPQTAAHCCGAQLQTKTVPPLCDTWATLYRLNCHWASECVLKCVCRLAIWSVAKLKADRPLVWELKTFCYCTKIEWSSDCRNNNNTRLSQTAVTTTTIHNCRSVAAPQPPNPPCC
jgi:hypothetical protein